MGTDTLLWEEKIEGFSIITHEGLTTLAHPQIGWTINSGMWNTLRTLWGLNMDTLVRIHESCKSQSHVKYADIFTPTRHILQVIRRTWKPDRVQGLPTVVVPTFFPSASTSEWTIWKIRDKEWSPALEETGFHQLLNIHKDKKAECWGFKITGWWRKGDI